MCVSLWQFLVLHGNLIFVVATHYTAGPLGSEHTLSSKCAGGVHGWTPQRRLNHTPFNQWGRVSLLRPGQVSDLILAPALPSARTASG